MTRDELKELINLLEKLQRDHNDFEHDNTSHDAIALVLSIADYDLFELEETK